MDRPRIAITMGDPAGVGPELCLALMMRADVLEQCQPLIFGDAGVLARVAERCGMPAVGFVLDGCSWHHTMPTAPTVIDWGAIAAGDVIPGHVTAATGRAAYTYIDEAIKAALTGHVDAVTTGPIHKEALRAAGVSHPGHTEIFAAHTGAARSSMMLIAEGITCSFVTTHVGYRDVPRLLSVARILDTIDLSADALRRLHGRPPRLVVCGLNPHAGECGLFGDHEEERLIVPAIEEARARGIDIEGPVPPDTAFLPARRRITDCFVCMYHDQGHIPLKALAFDRAVNVTLGLPIIRTSVDHGTACDIAWQSKADVGSLVQAVLLATRLVRHQRVAGA